MSYFNTVAVTGADPSGAVDSTAAFTAAMNALTNGGTVLIKPGIYKANIVINKSGITFDGSGGHILTSGTLSYIQPFDVTKPAVQIGDDTAIINGSGIRNIQLYTPTGTGQKGLVFAGGAQKCFAQNVQCLGFTVSCLEFRNDDNLACTFNLVNGYVGSTNVVGANAISFIDVHSAATTTATSISGTTLTCTINTGTISVGAPVVGAGITAGTKVVSQLTGTPGGSGTYQVSISQTVAGPITATFGGSGYTTACEVSNFNVTAANGYQVYCEAAQTNSMANGYIQCNYSGHGVFMSQPTGRLYSPRINFSCVDMDNVAGTGNVSVIVDNIGKSDYRVASQLGNLTPIMGQLNSAAATFYVAGHTTGSATAAGTTLTVASTAGIRPGRAIMVTGAGTSGRNLMSTVISVSGTTVTLGDTVVTTVSSVNVSYGDYGQIEAGGAGASFLNGPIKIGYANKKDLTSTNSGTLYGSNGVGTIAPFSGTGYIMDLQNKNLDFLQLTNTPTVSSLTQSGTTITVTTSSSHQANVGDIVVVDGITDVAGVNGTWTVASWVSSTVFTYTSTTSQTLTPAGTPTLTVFKRSTLNASSNGRLELSDSGVAMRAGTGTVSSVLYGDRGTAKGTYLQSADTTNGFVSILYGTGITTGAGLAIGTTAANKARITGNGVLWLVKASAPSVDSTAGQFFSSTSTGKNHVMDSASGTGPLSMALFIATADKTIANTTTATTMFGTGTGITSLPANSLVASRAIRITFTGFMSAVSAPTVSIAVKLGATTICTIPATALTGTISNTRFALDILLTCRTTGATGTVRGHADFYYTTTAANALSDTSIADVTIDTTAGQALDVQFTWGTASASNTITIDQAFLEYN